MSGQVNKQDNTTFEVDIGAGFVEFPCVTSFDKGSTDVDRRLVTCFSSPPNTAEYANGQTTFGEGSATYNADISNAIHQYFLLNEGTETPVRIRVTKTHTNGVNTYVAEADFLIGSVTEDLNFDATYTHTVGLQRTGASALAFA